MAPTPRLTWSFRIIGLRHESSENHLIRALEGKRVLFSRRWLLAAVSPPLINLVLLHGPDGQRVFINPAQVSTVREPSAAALGGRHFPLGTHCLIVTSNGKFLPVQETCDQVRALIDDGGR